MRGLGYTLITLGFLGASYVSVRQAEGVPVVGYLVGLAIGVAGIVLVRIALHREASHEETLVENLGTIEASLGEIVAKVDALDDRKDEVNVYDLRHEIDREFPTHLDDFVLARESIGHSFGLQAYADVMNPFAAGERYLNRVWSTSTDGYVDEAHTYLGMAREQFEEALAVFRRIRDEESAGSGSV